LIPCRNPLAATRHGLVVIRDSKQDRLHLVVGT
jgi:hypothetical protein